MGKVERTVWCTSQCIDTFVVVGTFGVSAGYETHAFTSEGTTHFQLKR